MSPVQLVEVAPRDGLQNEANFVPTDRKIAFVDALAQSGLTEIEVSAFVSPKWLPQLKDAETVFAGVQRRPGVVFSALVPNLRGLERALACRVDKVAVLAAASEAFSQRNLNADIATTLGHCAEVVRHAHLPVRGYVSTVVHCPFAGRIAPAQVVPVVERLLADGCTEISLGDTVGRATPDDLAALLDVLVPRFGAGVFALHLHDHDGLAVAGCRRGHGYGVTRFDCAVTARAGCPYAPGAGGNVATLALAEAFGVTLDHAALEQAVQDLQLG